MEDKRNVGQATASLVLGILSFVAFGLLTAIPAVICGHMAKSKIKRNPEELRGDGKALAGLIMGYISIGVSILVLPAILAAVAIPLMAGNVDRAVATEGQAGCSVVSTALRMHWAEYGNYDNINSVGDLASLQPGDLDGMYFDDDDYALVSLEDGQNFTVTVSGGGEDEDVDVTMRFVDGNYSWTVEYD